ncbi:MAG: hypothetical protein GY774_16405 [Planctomycetes bacterium]|nr:hypothetical protein [Planctomycetota bacterium]
MINKEAQDKYNFLLWYTDATPEDIEKARRTDEEAYEKFLTKYAYEIELINIKKLQSLKCEVS